MLTIPSFPELTFDESHHTYKVNGVYLPSVTTVMKPLSSEFYKGIDEGVLDIAASRGTAVHNAIENFVRFEIKDIAPEFDGYFQAFLRWWDDYKPVPIANESRVYHKYMRYAGTADMPCVVNNLVTCVDFKTSATLAEMLVRVQLEAYSKAFDSQGFPFQNKMAVQLKKDGSYKVEEYRAGDSEAWEVFGALLTVWGYIKKYRR